MGPKRFAIFASGTGSNALNLVQFSRLNPHLISVELLVTDSPRAQVIAKFTAQGVPVAIVPFEKNKKFHEAQILKVLAKHNIEWIILAGFMRILSQDFLQKFYDEKLDRNRVLNIHPSLLPSFKGANAYASAFAANVTHSGVTVHFVDSGVDSGPIILQKSFPRLPEDTLENFISRGKQLEHEIYPAAIRLLMGEKIDECR